MAEFLAIIIILWLTGIIAVPWLVKPHFPTLNLLGIHLTLENLLVAIVLVWILQAVGGPFRQIMWALVILWILSALGIIAIGGFGNLIMIGIVVGLVLSLVQKN